MRGALYNQAAPRLGCKIEWKISKKQFHLCFAWEDFAWEDFVARRVRFHIAKNPSMCFLLMPHFFFKRFGVNDNIQVRQNTADGVFYFFNNGVRLTKTKVVVQQ